MFEKADVLQCWISIDYQAERLWLHYFWVFIVEFGTIAIYGHVFIHLRVRIRNVVHNDVTKLARATKFMIMYPAVYVLLTLPIAVGRMVAMTGKGRVLAIRKYKTDTIQARQCPTYSFVLQAHF
jgi:hypothetical protein